MSNSCLSCHAVFADYKELAVHIAGSKKGHRRGKKWAAKYLLNVRYMDNKKDKPEGRVTLTEEQKEKKLSTFREVSGEVEIKLCVCPHCKQGHNQSLEIEFTNSADGWKGKTGLPVVMCSGCKN